jgi:hypothetical protein
VSGSPLGLGLLLGSRGGLGSQTLMATIPTETNTAAGKVDAAINSAIQTAIPAVEALVYADAPFLAIPVVKQLFEALLGYLAGKFSSVLQDVGTFTVIDVQVSNEQSAVTRALATLNAAKASGDTQAIMTAEQNYANAISSLIHSDGSSPSQ